MGGFPNTLNMRRIKESFEDMLNDYYRYSQNILMLATNHFQARHWLWLYCYLSIRQLYNG